MGRTYIETFDDGPGGWLGWESNAKGALRLEMAASAVVSRGPWWIDYNHAPPGGGYLHLPFALLTQEGPNFRQQYRDLGGRNRFVEGGYPLDWRGARLTARLRGEMQMRGAQLLLLAQAKVGDIYVNHVLTAQPFAVTPAWTETTISIEPDPQQWKCMGSRHDRLNFYGWGDVRDVLADLNGDIIFVLHPLDVVPLPPIAGDFHRQRAGEDFEVDRSRLPAGWLMLDEVRIEFPHA